MQKHTTTDNDPLLCTLHSDDANRQAANLINWQQEFDQLSHGRFLGVINEIKFPDIHVFREDTSHQLRQQCRVEDGGFWLGFSANKKNCRINNELSPDNRFLCRPGSRDFELLTPDDFSIYGLVLHPSFFDSNLEQEEENQFDHSFHDLWLDNLSPLELIRFQEYLSILLDPNGNRWSSATQEVILKDAILELLTSTRKDPLVSVAPQQRQKIMKRVKCYLTESRLKQPLTVSEICQAVHVSRRTLQYTFAHCCGMSPKQFIQITRLNQVRRALLKSDDSETISEIAFDYGFFHLGQFGQDYKKLFGETPQETRLRETN